MIGGRSPGKPTDVRVFNCFNILSSRKSTDRNEDVAYMADETGRQYFYKYREDGVKSYVDKYLMRWLTPDQLDKRENKYEKKKFPGYVEVIHCSRLFLNNCPTQDKDQYLRTKKCKLASLQCESWCEVDLYCWHCKLGRSRTNKDINVLSDRAY